MSGQQIKHNILIINSYDEKVPVSQVPFPEKYNIKKLNFSMIRSLH